MAAWLAVTCAVCSLAAGVQAQEGFRAWVGLYGPADLGWLENENRLGELCADPSALPECYERHLSPRISLYELRGSPSDSSARMGDLIVAATPGRGLSAYFRAAEATESARYELDLTLQDWGYGPYFHQTLSEERGDWIRLPRGPWETEAWLHRVSDAAFPVLEIRAGDIVAMEDAGWYVVAAERDALLLRPEQPGDHWCEEGEAPEVESVEAALFSREQLVDSGGHLILRLKYLKGC